MKIRIQESTLQFRLSQNDLEILERDQSLETRLEIQAGLSWQFCLRVSSESTTEELRATSNRVELMLPAAQFANWNQSYEIEWQFQTSLSPLTFLIEKDLKDQRQR